MITIEDKIRTFSNYVYKKEVDNSSNLLEEIDKKNNKTLQEKTREYEKKSAEIEEKTNKKIEQDTYKIIATARLEGNNKLLKLKKELLESLIDEIYEDIRQFTNTDKYDEYINKELEAVYGYLLDKETVIYLTSKDKERYKKRIEEKFPAAAIKNLSEESIGGMLIDSGKERIDLTLKAKADGFKNEIGLRLYEALEK